MAMAEGEAAAVQWQGLPRGARTVSMLLGAAFGILPAFPALGLAAARLQQPWWIALGVAVAGVAIGLWRGERAWRHTHWRLDDTGFTLRRGKLWRRETRVPQSRVQHLDLRRGPLQRRFGLSTLVIHTAGTRHSAVTVRGLDAGDAERLRDTLARQVDDGE
jgi:membrane protein YdbS with pleckstrin-like domain